jgi:hypothetical protein
MMLPQEQRGFEPSSRPPFWMTRTCAPQVSLMQRQICPSSSRIKGWCGLSCPPHLESPKEECPQRNKVVLALNCERASRESAGSRILRYSERVA